MIARSSPLIDTFPNKSPPASAPRGAGPLYQKGAGSRCGLKEEEKNNAAPIKSEEESKSMALVCPLVAG